MVTAWAFEKGDVMLDCRLAVWAVGLVAVLAGGVSGQTVTDSAKTVEAQLAADDYAAAIATSRDLLGQVWDMTPDIGFSEAVLIAEPASGYGIYNLRPTISYKLGESIFVYAEPYGYGYGSPGEGLYSIGFFVDLQVMAADGSILGEVPDVAELDLTSRVKNREFQATITYDLSGIEPGSYVLVTRLRDKNSAKSGSFETPIEITP